MDAFTLNNWQIHVVKKDEKKRPLFSGFVENKKVVFFSSGFDASIEAIISETGLRYKLGTVHPQYEHSFPNAKKTLLTKLRQNRK